MNLSIFNFKTISKYVNIKLQVNEKCFFVLFISIFLFALVIVSVANYVMDPYSLFNHHLTRDISWEPREHVRFNHIYNVTKQKYNGLILGTSRAQLGIDIKHPAWKELNAYNLALPIMSILEKKRLIMHVGATNKLEQVLIGLDFFAFSPTQSVNDPLSEAALLTDKIGNIKNRRISKFILIPKYLLSYDVFENSKEKFHAQSGKQNSLNPELLKNKLNNNKSNSKYITTTVEQFLNAEYAYFSRDSIWFPLHEKCHVKRHPITRKTGLDYYEKLLHYIYKNNINTYLFISPVHIRMYIGLYGIGLFEEFENWKFNIVISNENIASLYNKKPIPLWDFLLVNQYNIEAFDFELRKNEIKMNWFIDSAHYSKFYGDIIQNQIFGEKNGPGILLTNDIVYQHIVRERIKLENYMEENTDTVKNIHDNLRSQNTLDLPNLTRTKSSNIECL